MTPRNQGVQLIHGRIQQVSCSLHQAREQHFVRYEGDVNVRHYYYANIPPDNWDHNMEVLSSVTHPTSPERRR